MLRDHLQLLPNEDCLENTDSIRDLVREFLATRDRPLHFPLIPFSTFLDYPPMLDIMVAGGLILHKSRPQALGHIRRSYTRIFLGLEHLNPRDAATILISSGIMSDIPLPFLGLPLQLLKTSLKSQPQTEFDKQLLSNVYWRFLKADIIFALSLNRLPMDLNLRCEYYFFGSCTKTMISSKSYYIHSEMGHEIGYYHAIMTQVHGKILTLRHEFPSGGPGYFYGEACLKASLEDCLVHFQQTFFGDKRNDPFVYCEYWHCQVMLLLPRLVGELETGFTSSKSLECTVAVQQFVDILRHMSQESFKDGFVYVALGMVHCGLACTLMISKHKDHTIKQQSKRDMSVLLRYFESSNSFVYKAYFGHLVHKMQELGLSPIWFRGLD